MDNEKKEEKSYVKGFLISALGCGVCLILFASCPPLFFIALFVITYIAMGQKKKK